MNYLHKILLLALLSLSFPIGRLFEIFCWDKCITKTEVVFYRKRSTIERRTCVFVKIAERIRRSLADSFIYKIHVEILEHITAAKNNHLLHQLMCRVNNYKKIFFRRFLFNMIYSDDSEHAAQPA